MCRYVQSMSKLRSVPGMISPLVTLACLHSSGGLAQVGFRDDVISFEHTPRPVTTNLHSPLFWDASTHHVSDRGSSQIVKEKTAVPNIVAVAGLAIRRTVARSTAISAHHRPKSGRSRNLPPRL